jgi:hypothetical protein
MRANEHLEELRFRGVPIEKSTIFRFFELEYICKQL